MAIIFEISSFQKRNLVVIHFSISTHVGSYKDLYQCGQVQDNINVYIRYNYSEFGKVQKKVSNFARKYNPLFDMTVYTN